MSNVLTNIATIKRATIARRKKATPLRAVERAAAETERPRGFGAALTAKITAGGYGLIAEIKKASPSAGLIRPDFDPSNLARAYEQGGAACLSVLTEEDHFQGNDAHLVSARAAVELPILRKDFMLEPYQVVEARAIGADCILLIMALLDDTVAAELESTAQSYGLDVLIEVHDEQELERALLLKSPLIGVNNRDLKTLKIDLAVTERLAALIPKDRVLVCESGLKTRDDLARMAKVGTRRFLIGEALMKQTNVAAATAALLGQEKANA